MTLFVAATNATDDIGTHITRQLFGLTINVDTVISTCVAGGILLLLGFYLRAKATAGVPGKLQLAFESVVGGVEDQVESSLGDRGKSIVPLAFTLFMFILFANLLEFIPSGHSPEYLPAPAADVNFTFALALLVIILVHVTWIAKQGFKSYIGHYFKPIMMTPIIFVEELTKPITLALRLFGNIFTGGLMLVIIASIIPAKTFVPIPLLDVIWKLFDVFFIGPLQAFIFALLTILYFESAITGSSH